MTKLPGKIDGRDGVRPGVGRKPAYVISEKEVKKLVEAAEKKTKETSKGIADVLIDLAYQKDDKRTALAAIRIYLDHTITKTTEKDINLNDNQNYGPTIFKTNDQGEMVITQLGSSRIFLPEIKPDPNKLIPINGNKE
jgi:hypothetical protein